MALVVAVASAVIAFGVGVPLGMAAGYFGGWVDRIVSVVVDAFLAVPAIVVSLAVVLFLGPSLRTVVLVIGVLSIAPLARFARAATANVAERDFVTAARMSGARRGRLLVVEIGPNVLAPLASYVLLIAGIAILAEGGLSFLGLGVSSDKASWGRLIASGRDQLRDAWWWSLCPSAVFFLTIYSLNVLQDHFQSRFLGIASPSLGGNLEPEVRPPLPTVPLVPDTDHRKNGDGHPLIGSVGAVLDVVDMRTYIPTALGTVRAVDGVSFSISRGEMLAVVGESGAGKSMLVRSLLGVAPPAAIVSGGVVLDGADLTDPVVRRRSLGRDIGVVLQDPMTSLDPVMRIGWQIAEPARVHLGLSRSAARTRALELLETVGIGEPVTRFRQYPHELSGGLRQRVAIALALSCDPKVLIADEPTSALDAIVQRQILDLLDQLRATRKLAVLLITHDLPMATARADRVAVLYAGRIMESAPAVGLVTQRYVPYTEALFNAVPRLDMPSHQRLTPIPGRAPGPFDRRPAGCAYAARCPSATTRCEEEVPPLNVDAEQRSWTCWNPSLRRDSDLGVPAVLGE